MVKIINSDDDIKIYENKNHFKRQMAVFYKFVCLVNSPVLVHIGGSYCLKHKIPKFVNMVRVGYFLYGYGSSKLKPVMQIQSKITKIIKVKKGQFVGYGATKLKKTTQIAIVPVGYADGIPRNLSNKGSMYVKIKINKRQHLQQAKIIGKVCMDMLMIDVASTQIALGQKVIILKDAKIYAKLANTSPYEILTNFAKFRGRVIVK